MNRKKHTHMNPDNQRLNFIRRSYTEEEKDLLQLMWWFTKLILITYALVDIGAKLLRG